MSESEREALRERLKGVGFHSEKRSGVRTPEFRALPPKIQEELAGTKYSTLRETYDHVTPEDMREAIRASKQPDERAESRTTASTSASRRQG